jgi:hypothetical protein
LIVEALGTRFIEPFNKQGIIGNSKRLLKTVEVKNFNSESTDINEIQRSKLQCTKLSNPMQTAT